MSRNPDLTLFIHTPYHGIGEMISPDFATSLALSGIARDKKRGILKTAISRLHSGGGFRIILSVFLTEGWPSG